MTVPHGFSKQDSQRIAEFVKRREFARAMPGYTPTRIPQLFDVQVLICTSEPNVEAIGNGGDWPLTINAKVMKESDGYRLQAIQGRCGELNDGGGDNPGDCDCEPQTPCSKNARIKFVWGLNAPLFGAIEGDVAAVLTFSHSDNSSNCEKWIFVSDDGEWTATLGVKDRGGFVACDGDCYGTAEVVWNNPPPGSPAAYWLMVAFLGDLVNGGRCQYICSQGVVFDTPTGIGEQRSVLTMFWEGAASALAATNLTTGAPPPPGVDDDGDVVVWLHKFINGIPFYGEAFLGVHSGGQWYAIGCHHSGIAGSITDRSSPRTVFMDRCDFEVPFVYTFRDPMALPGIRHLLSWCSAKRKYVMVAMGDCE